MTDYNYTSEITSQLVDILLTANVTQSNIINTDVLGRYTGSSISLQSSILPNVSNVYAIGTSFYPLQSTYSEYVQSTTGNITNVIVDNLRPQNTTTSNITFYANLIPAIDDYYYVGVPTYRWKNMNVSDFSATGNVDLSSAQLDLVDISTIIHDDIDNTKRFRFEANVISSNSLRVLTVPDSDTTIVGTQVTQTLSNKTIIDPTNIVRATQLATTGFDVIISSSFQPTTGQVLTATSGTTAAWLPANVSASAISIKNDGSNIPNTPHVSLSFNTYQGIIISASDAGSGIANVQVAIPTTTKGDIVVFDGTTNVRLPVSTHDYLLTANSAAVEGVSWSAPIFKDGLFKIVDSSDASKELVFDVTGSPNVTTQLISTSTIDRSLTFPDATTTLVGTDTSQILTNKTIIDPTNIVRSTLLATSNTSINVLLTAALPPVSGQVLTAINGNTAIWITPNVTANVTSTIVLKNNNVNIANTPHSSLNFIDNQGIVISASDYTGGTANVSVSVPTTTKGDFIVYDGVDNVRLPVGTNDYLLTANLASSTGVSWSAPIFKDGLFKIVDLSDTTKEFNIDVNGTTGTSTTLLTSQTTDRVLTLPDTTDILVANAFTATLTNKTIVGSTNYVGADELKTTTNPVIISSSPAPITGQVLTATSPTNAVWSTPSGNATNAIDNTFLIRDDVDGTKQFRFEANAISSNTTRVFTMPDASTVVVGTDTMQTLSNKSLIDNSTAIVNVSDNTKSIKFDAAGSTSTSTTLLSSQTANRVLTIPDTTDILVANTFTATLTNKTIVGSTNYVGANELKTTANSVVVSSALPPITGQVLTATSPTSAVWQTPSGNATNAIDNTFVIRDNADATKQFRFEANVISSNTTRVFTMPDADTTLVGTDTTQSISNKSLIDNTTTIVDVVDNTKSIKFDAAGTTSTSTTLLSSQTINRVLTLPDTTDILVANAFTATLTNKTIVGSTNYVGADELKTTTNPVIVSSAPAPITGQVLTATSPTTAVWQTPSGNATNAIDNTFTIRDNVDGTKQFRFEANSISSNTTRVFTMPDADTVLVGTDTTQSLSNKLLIDNSTAIVDVSDNTKSIKFDAAGTTSTSTTLLSSQTSNQILTLPDTTDILVANAFAAILTNKTIVGSTNYVGTDELKTTGNPVVISSASPPVSGQVLTATSSTTAVWVTPSGNATNAIDNTFIIRDDVDGTKQFRFEANAISSNTTRVFTMPDDDAVVVGADTLQLLSNKSLIDNTTSIVNVSDNTKSIKFDAAGTTGTSTTLLSSQTSNQILTLPDTTDILVANAFAAILTNKTIVGSTNYVGANELKTTANAVVVSSALPPVSGQVLIATSPTAAVWATPSGNATNAVDNTFTIRDDLDGTKQFRFEANAISSNTTRVFIMPDASTTLVGTDTTQTISNKSLIDNNTSIIDVSDDTIMIRFDAAGTTSTSTTLLSSQTSNRVLTLPDTTDILVANAFTATLTNKTIVGSTNYVGANELKTTTNAVIVSAANAPTIGQVLTATSSTNAVWVTPSSNATSAIDNTFIISDDADNTKQFRFEANAISTSTLRVLTMPDASTTLVGTDNVQTISNKSLIDNNTSIIDVSDNTKSIKFDAAGTTGTSTTLLSSQTTNRVLTLPDTTDILVANAFAAILTNKTIIGSTNYVGADELKTTTNPVVVSGASAPVTGQILTATSSTNAIWQTPSGNATNAVDNTFLIRDNIDGTKQFRFEANVISSNTTRVFTMPDANTTLVGTDTIQTISNKSLIDNTTAIVDVSDNTKSIKFDAAGTTGTSTTLLSSQTANRILTLPNTTDVLVANAFTAILTNKTIVGSTNYVGANELKTTTNPVVVSSAIAPMTGQVLIATSNTTAMWLTPSGNATNAIDNTFTIRDDVDATKQFRFEASAITTSTTRVFTMPDANTTLVGTDNAQLISNKSLVDDSTSIVDVSDNTKAIKFNAAGTTGTATTLLSSQTTNRILTIPDTTDILVANAFTASLSNKTIVGSTNYVGANELKTTTNPVIVSSAIAPITGQVLIATSPTSAMWQTPSSTATDAIDNTFVIRDNVDGTKQFRFEANAISTATTRIFTMPDANTIVVGTDTIQSLSNKSLIDNTTSIVDASDNTKSIRFDAAGTTSTSTTLLSSQTINRVLTLPDTTDVLVANAFTATLTNKNITGSTNYIGANELKTTGSPVVISSAIPPVAGQVLTSLTSTSAIWKTIALPTGTVDVQTTTSTTTVSTTSTTYVDLDTITPFTIITSNTLSMKYIIVFSSTFDITAGNKTASFIINVDGVDVAASEKIIDAQNSATKALIMTHCLSTIDNGKTIKMRYKTTGGTLNVYQRVLTAQAVYY